MYGATIERSRFVSALRATTSAWRSRKRVLSCGICTPLREQRGLVAEVTKRVLGERLERLGHPALLVGEVPGASSSAPRSRPAASLDPLRKTLEPRTTSGSPSFTDSKSSAPGASIRQTPPSTSASGPAFG